ncbi:Transposon Ty3-I Gag-Pol polyprotein [Vitis vinifera]|uniref:Transposon Ty3-I Gag-Pol polyprotein n=1 Tax=Vitis vinifera TaxID=29760 RepID=A0A438CUJ5_VITVI|nr:Transposon Ty3-I Gag-Pol polyprotein [Vitis vinifera]
MNRARASGVYTLLEGLDVQAKFATIMRRTWCAILSHSTYSARLVLEQANALVTYNYLLEHDSGNECLQFMQATMDHDDVENEEACLIEALVQEHTENSWVSPTQVVPKKSGITVVKNDEGELIPTRLTIGWGVCIDFRKLNAVTKKDHFPLPFLYQVLERVAGHDYYCFLDGYSNYFQVAIALEDQEKTTFTCLFGTYAYKCMPFGFVMR